MGVEVAEVDDIGAACKGAKGRSAGLDLGGGRKREQGGKEAEKSECGEISHPTAAGFEMTMRDAVVFDMTDV